MLEDNERDQRQETQEPGQTPEDQEVESAEEASEAVREESPAETAAVTETDLSEETDPDSEIDPELMKLYEESMMDLEEGEIVKGTILKVDEKEVLVDVGFKSEGVIAIEEFGDAESIKVGDEVDVFLEKMENQDGLVVLSKQRADFVKVWDSVKDAADTGSVVEGRLLRKIKGGVVVDLFGVEAFLPGSQIALRQVQNVDELLGRTMRFKIIKLNKRRRNIVVSRRSMLEEEREEMKTKVLSELAKDQIREGVVKNITDFGAFVDLGGIDGLLHITDMSWGRISHPSEVVAIGDKVAVKVLNFDKERERISLGLKQLTRYPWEDVDQKYAVGDRVKGRVVSITDYGAFIELEKGVEGLIHISEMSWTKHIRHPSKVLAVGDTIEAVVLKVDKENEKISLGLKQIEPDPWLTLEERYPVGSRITGKVRNLTNFGAFVELEEGIDGLVHISDMSWTRRIGHPSEVLKKGDTVEVVILSVDKDARRVSLGLKQVSEDPWPIIAEKYNQDTVCTGKIVRLLEKGVVVDLGGDLEGFVPISQLGVDNLKKPSDAFSEGDEIPLKPTRVDIPNHRIVLSVKAYMSAQDQAIIEEYKAKHAPKPSTIGDVASEEVREAGSSETDKEKPEPEKAKPSTIGDVASEEVRAAGSSEAEKAKPSTIGDVASEEVKAAGSSEADKEPEAEKAKPEAGKEPEAENEPEAEKESEAGTAGQEKETAPSEETKTAETGEESRRPESEQDAETKAEGGAAPGAGPSAEETGTTAEETEKKPAAESGAGSETRADEDAGGSEADEDEQGGEPEDRTPPGSGA